jgi:hypothetical protein
MLMRVRGKRLATLIYRNRYHKVGPWEWALSQGKSVFHFGVFAIVARLCEPTTLSACKPERQSPA